MDQLCKKGNNWNIHALTKLLRYMRLYGSATNFNDGTGDHNLQSC